MRSLALQHPIDFVSCRVLQVRGAFTALNNCLLNVQPCVLVAGTASLTYFLMKVFKVYRRDSDKSFQKRLLAYGFSWFRCLPSIRRQIEEELEKARFDIQHSLHSSDNTECPYILELSEFPLSDDCLLAKMKAYQATQTRFNVSDGRVSGAVYTEIDDEEHMALLVNTFRQFAYTNPLHPDLFPGVRRMEAEILRIVASLFNGPPETSCGSVTSGGTESIVLACLSARNRAYACGIRHPVFVVPTTAHAAFDKAAALLSVQIRHVRVDPISGRVDVQAMKRSICRRTCLLVGSAPNFPTGTVDNIPAIAKLGEKYNIPVHVDACLGGFILAFAEDIGLQCVPTFDFRLPGVTSISCDTHKYGYAPKGTSTIIYRTRELLHYQYQCVAEWTGGIYATPTLAGSRPGLNIALCWATLLHFGRNEYVRRAQKIMEKARLLADGISKVHGLRIHGSPDVSVVAFMASDGLLNIHAVGDELNRRGWNLNCLQNPNAIHMTLTYIHANRGNFLAEFLADVNEACQCVREMPNRGDDSKTAALYGIAARIPDKSLVDDMAAIYLDACYSIGPPQ